MEWLSENLFGLISLLFGAGGIGYALVSKWLDRKKYACEVRDAKAEADIKGDEFWKKRYDVLAKEQQDKDVWWKERYNTLYEEYQNERRQSNEMIKSFRTELNEMRNDYERQREIEKKKYDDLMLQYRSLEEDSQKRDTEYKKRIQRLEQMLAQYEKNNG